MAGVLTIDPRGVHGLAGVLDQLADDAFGLAAEARRSAASAALDIDAPGRLEHLGGAARAAAVVLRRRADLAAGFVVSLSGALVALRRSSPSAWSSPSAPPSTGGGVVPAGGSTPGPHPAGDVVRVDLISVEGELSLPGKGIAPSIGAAHAYRVQHLRNGRLRVTRLDRVAAGIGAGAAGDLSIDVSGIGVTTGAKAEGAIRLLVAAGDTFDIAADELDDLIVADLLDRAGTVPAVQGVSPRAVVRVGRAATGLADRFDWGPFDGIVRRAHQLMSARLPPPVSRFVEGGAEVRGSLAAVSAALLGLSFGAATYSVVGIERRDRERRDVVYVEAGGEVQAGVQRSLFGRTGTDAEGEVRIGVVRDRASGALVQLELSSAHRTGGDVQHHLVRVDLADPDARRVLGELRDAAPDPDRVAAAVASLVALPSTRIEHVRLRRTRDDVDSVDLAGNGLRLVRRSFTAVDR